jgi:hypothetical protein
MRLENITGTLPTSEITRLKRILFRCSKNNIIILSEPIDLSIYQSSKIDVQGVEE